jgi:hypothetical protein
MTKDEVIAGVLFDFMGWLTSRKERIVLSASDDAAPAVDAIRDFAKLRGLSLDDAQVRTWQEALAEPVQKPEYWHVIDPAGNIVASETDAIRGWARIAGYKPKVEGLLGFHEEGWRVVPAPPLPVQERVTKITWDARGVRTVNGVPDDAPQRQPLTDEQIINAMHEDGCERIENFYVVGPVQKAAVFSFARAIEAKVKGKNT